jgi:hypothetical protein
MFVDRVQRQPGAMFHGGQVPDACDFRTFALVARARHTFVMHKILEDREDKSFEHWLDRMDGLCSARKGI